MHCFSQTGGIEKVCRTLAHALDGMGNLTLFSLHDARQNKRPYVGKGSFRGFRGRGVRFIWSAIKRGFQTDVLVISHVNLALPAILIKMLRPGVKLIVLAHGIEIWEKPVGSLKRIALKKADAVVAVSAFTASKLAEMFGVKSTVINNCLDPFLKPAAGHIGELGLRFGLADDEQVVLTLSRLSAGEQKKGYDKVVESVALLVGQGWKVKYVFAGKYDEAEKARLEHLAASYGIAGHLIFPGFVADEELGDLFGLADVYIMPSKKEGFGISFIEAMHFGLPVIAGNADGSVDALLGGQLGVLVNPDDFEEISEALRRVLQDPSGFAPNAALLHSSFGFDAYRQKWQEVLS